MNTDYFDWDDYHAVHCAKGRICTSRCVSKCQTSRPMRPEEMVKYGWDIERAKEKQATALAVYYKLNLVNTNAPLKTLWRRV